MCILCFLSLRTADAFPVVVRERSDDRTGNASAVRRLMFSLFSSNCLEKKFFLAACIILFNLLLYVLYSFTLPGSVLYKLVFTNLCLCLIECMIAFEIQGLSKRFRCRYDALRKRA